MKERFLFEDSLEQHLRQKSDEFKMYPSDKVWAGIDNKLHERRKRFIFFMTFLVSGILIFAGTEFFGPSKPVRTSLRIVQQPAETEAQPLDISQFAAPATQTEKTSSSGVSGARQTAVVRAPFVSSWPVETIAAANSQSGKQTTISLNPGIVGASLPASLSNFRLPLATGAGNSETAAESEASNNLPKPAIVNTDLKSNEPADLANAAEKPKSARMHGNRFSWEIYVTPTLLTRRLGGLEYQRLNPNISNGPITVVRYANVNGFVDNTPALGYDIGGNLKYRVSPRLAVKAGLAFNFSRYFIQTYNSQPSYSSPVINTYLGYIADSLVTQNAPSSGYGEPKSQQRLQNQYYTLSVPVGLEWKVAGKGKWEVYLGATVQPGYLLNRNAYTISGDYGSYEKNPSSFNRWNLNTGAEAFVSYKVGKIRWELGPQVRYQLFSSYKTGSPIRENLLIYGIRIGFSKAGW